MLNLFKILLIFFSTTIYSQISVGKEVNVYSYRQPILINPFFEEFTKNTGINVNVLHAKKGLLERLKAEGADTPADVVLTVDISRLSQFVENDVLQPIESSILESTRIGSNPNCITGAKSVAQATDGTTTLQSLYPMSCPNADNIRRLADEPELQNTEYFLPNHLDHFSSNSKVNGPFVNLG